MHLEPLPLTFSARDTTEVARALLGQVVVLERGQRRRTGRIVETEAYLGPHDLACHTAKGRTKRTEPMFGPPGHAYVYLVYGMHFCLNVVTGHGAAVLLRALEPLDAENTDDASKPTMNGPAKLTKVLGVTLSHNTLPLDVAPLWLARGEAVPPRFITARPRIGVDYAGAWAKRKLRFYDSRSRHISKP
ncbi:MAG: DNA-3-methyladenine glycosylase [Myxococcaceae bacterium]